MYTCSSCILLQLFIFILYFAVKQNQLLDFNETFQVSLSSKLKVVFAASPPRLK